MSPENTLPLLFRPLTLRSVTFPNRIWLAPMCQYSVRDGMPGDWQLVHLGARAAGRFGLIMTEATAVTADGRISPGDTGIWTDEQAQAWARIVDFLREQGAVTGIQLAHAGRKASTHVPWAPVRGSVDVSDGGWQTVGPSPLAFPGYAEPREMTTADISAVTSAFRSAAVRADRAGFDVVELHAAHGYLLHQFLSPLSNRRTDAYGGSLAGRARFLLEVVEAVRGVWPDGKPLFVRVSATDWADGGLTVEDTAVIAGWLRERGVDLVDVSTGGLVPASIPVGPSYQVPAAGHTRRNADLPVSAVGLITEAAQAEAILQAGESDAVMLARAALSDPHWPLHAAAELGLTPEQARWPKQYERGAR